jgi:hypothetical protein
MIKIDLEPKSPLKNLVLTNMLLKSTLLLVTLMPILSLLDKD